MMHRTFDYTTPSLLITFTLRYPFLCILRFELAVFVVIMLNMISMGIEHYEQSAEVTLALDIINIIFSTVFTIEAIVKIIAFRQFYFTVAWNIFDLVLVVSSIIGWCSMFWFLS